MVISEMNLYRRKMLVREINFNPEGVGLVYLCTSKWIPGLVKIGSSRQADPQRRLYVSSIPDPVMAATWREDPPWALERKLHAHFQDFRVSGEWYKLSVGEVIAVVEKWQCPDAI